MGGCMTSNELDDDVGYAVQSSLQPTVADTRGGQKVLSLTHLNER